MQNNTLQIPIKASEQINAIKANDSQALKSLYQDNFYKVEKYVLNNNGSVEQAQDIYQEAFIAVWRNIQLEKFYPENETALAGYLFRIAKNKWLDYLRSSQHKKVIPMNQADIELPAEEVTTEAENEYIIAVKKNFKELGDNCQQVLTRFYYHKESLKLIAKTFDWTEATARNNKYRCLQRLRELLKK